MEAKMADDIVIKIDGIEGESQLKGHIKEIDVNSVSWGMHNTVSTHTGGGGGSGKVQFQDVHFSKHFDAASHLLQMRCADGKHIPKAEINFRKQGEGQKEYLTVTLTDLLISSYQGGNGGEQFSIQFSKFKFDYKQQDAKGVLGGSKSFAFDIKANAVV
jgi:type VI secretion system secreted protein Hcp